MTCQWCDNEAAVKVNDHDACMEHIDDAMAVAFSPVKTLLRMLRTR